MGGVLSFLTHSESSAAPAEHDELSKAHVGRFLQNIPHLSYRCSDTWVKEEISEFLLYPTNEQKSLQPLLVVLSDHIHAILCWHGLWVNCCSSDFSLHLLH